MLRIAEAIRPLPARGERGRGPPPAYEECHDSLRQLLHPQLDQLRGLSPLSRAARSAIASAGSDGGKVLSTASATFAPTPCTVCNSRNHSRSMSLRKPNSLI